MANHKEVLAIAKNPEVLRGKRHQRIAAFFRERRLASGLSLEQVATSIEHVEVSELEGYEAGISPIPLDLIFALTNVLNIAPEDVMNLIYDAYNENQNDG